MTGTFRRLLVCAAAAIAASGAAPGAAQAHHSTARYDLGQQRTVEGAVTRVQWANPHVYLFVDETTPDGETIEWEVEGFGASGLRRLGWSRDTLQPGDVVTVVGSPARNDARPGLYPMSIRLGDVTIFDAQSVMARMMNPGDAPGAAASGLTGVWETLLNLQVVLPFAVRPQDTFALTEAGAAAVEAYDDRTMNPAIDCIPGPSPLMMLIPAVKEIAIDGDAIRIGSEYDDSERVIHLDLADHEGATPSLQGHSIGHWEGDALVIDTTAFAEHRQGDAAGLPSGPDKHLVERLSLNEDRTRLVYAFELSDPDYLAEPVTGEAEWLYRPDLTFDPPACDLESARRYTEE